MTELEALARQAVADAGVRVDDLFTDRPATLGELAQACDALGVPRPAELVAALQA